MNKLQSVSLVITVPDQVCPPHPPTKELLLHSILIKSLVHLIAHESRQFTIMALYINVFSLVIKRETGL